MKIRHYYFFGREKAMDTLSAENWDELRLDEKPGPFSIERNIDDYEKNCTLSVEYYEAAEAIVRLWDEYKLGKRLVSLGCGKGIVEWHIKKLMPELYIKCTDYATESLELLKKVFVECDEFKKFDMLSTDDYKELRQDEALLMYRVSTEFSFEQWKEVFEKLYEGGVQNIIFVPTEVLNFSIAINEKKNHLANWVKHRKNTFCGWMYSRKEFEKIFRGINGKLKYEIVHCEMVNDTEIWLMTRVK